MIEPARERVPPAPEALSSKGRGPIRYLVLIDGEHYPSVTESALREITERGAEVLAAVLVGGTEKLGPEGIDAFGDIRVLSGGDARELLAAAIADHRPEAVLDLSDEPVLDYRRRHQLAALALYHGVEYRGADFRFSPPPRPRLCSKPSIAIIGTGKRTGKTAVSALAARVLAGEGRRPVVVAMGRGGPDEPEVLEEDDTVLDPRGLVEIADAGKHAASDYIEDAFLARVPTVGCRRCGGGLAGAVATSNVAQGVEIANRLAGDMLVLEGSGSAIPPVHADATALVLPATVPIEYLVGYMGPYRLLLSDLAVVTMCESPFGSPSRVSALTSQIEQLRRPDRKGDSTPTRVVRTVLRPTPTRSVEGADVFVATTALEEAGDSIRRHLEEEHGCRVVAMSHSLSDRARLETELTQVTGKVDVVLCEIKAAGVDVATRYGLARGLDVVYMDNVPHAVDGDDLTDAIMWSAELAASRFSDTHGR